MKIGKQTRRNLIPCVSVFLAGTLLLGSGFLSPASAEEPSEQTQRPAGTCPAWIDKDNSGFCDRSEDGAKPCRRIKCPGHADNPPDGSRSDKIGGT